MELSVEQRYALWIKTTKISTAGSQNVLLRRE